MNKNNGTYKHKGRNKVDINRDFTVVKAYCKYTVELDLSEFLNELALVTHNFKLKLLNISLFLFVNSICKLVKISERILEYI